MKLIKPSYKILNQPPGLQGIYEQIELAGRTCYASSHKIQYQENNTCNGFISTTAKDFVDRMIASQHYAMLEHGTVYLKIPKGTYAYDHYVVACLPDDDFFSNSYELAYRPYTKVNIQEDYIYVTTNLRVLQEHNWLDDLKYLCEPTEFHEKRVTVRFTTDRGVSHEFVRHRVFSFAQESTRYCNYSKDKFGKEITFIAPSWMDNTSFENVDNYLHGREYDMSFGSINLVNALSQCELCYLSMINEGLKPQQARAVLPNALKTELVMTGFVSDWKHFFDLRAIGTTGAPHPDAKALVEPLMCEFKKRDWI